MIANHDSRSTTSRSRKSGHGFSLAVYRYGAFDTVGRAIKHCARAEPPSSDNAAAEEFFEKKIRPLLVDNCYNCHSANTNSQGGLRVDDRNGLLNGGERGPAIVPGDPESSVLLRAVSHTDDDLKMPPKKQLSAEQVADLTAVDPDGRGMAGLARPGADRRTQSCLRRIAKRALVLATDSRAASAGGERFILGRRPDRRVSARAPR